MDNLTIYFFFFRLSGLILSIFFIIGIIYYFRKLKIITNWQNKWRAKLGISSLSTLFSRSNRQWKKIDNLLREPYQSSWKLAVLQAEGIVERTLKQIGFRGENFAQQITELEKRGYRNLNILSDLYQKKEKIISDNNFTISLEQAREMVNIYRAFWKEVIDSL